MLHTVAQSQRTSCTTATATVSSRFSAFSTCMGCAAAGNVCQRQHMPAVPRQLGCIPKRVLVQQQVQAAMNKDQLLVHPSAPG